MLANFSHVSWPTDSARMNAPPGSRIESLMPTSWAVWRRRLRKLAIIAFFMLVLVPVAILNCGVNLEKAGFPMPAARLKKGMPAFDAFRSCGSNGRSSPTSHHSNYTIILEVGAEDGSTVPLPDSVRSTPRAGRAFCSMAKRRFKTTSMDIPPGIAVTSNTPDLAKRINPAEVSQRIIYIRYRNPSSRSEAAKGWYALRSGGPRSAPPLVRTPTTQRHGEPVAAATTARNRKKAFRSARCAVFVKIDAFFFPRPTCRLGRHPRRRGAIGLVPLLLSAFRETDERLYGHWASLPRSESLDAIYGRGSSLLLTLILLASGRIPRPTCAAASRLAAGFWMRIAGGRHLVPLHRHHPTQLMSFNGETGILIVLAPGLALASALTPASQFTTWYGNVRSCAQPKSGPRDSFSQHVPDVFLPQQWRNSSARGARSGGYRV